MYDKFNSFHALIALSIVSIIIAANQRHIVFGTVSKYVTVYSRHTRTNAYRCLGYNVADFESVTTSLNDEESFLHSNYFKGVCGGRYAELGAHDGINQDNTLAFHKILNWTGLLIEPSPARFEKLRKNRKRDTLVNKAICQTSRTVHFIDRSYVGGILEFMNDEFINYWHSKVDMSALPTIQCSTFESIASKDANFYDFLSLDVEGAEYPVLETLGSIEFGVVLVESDGRNPVKDYSVRSLLENNGYIFDGKHNRSQWFVNRKWHSIYRDIMYEQ